MDSDDTPSSDEAKLDFGPLASSLGYLLRRAQLAVFQDFHRCCAGYDIRPAQYSVLVLLRHNAGVQQSRVADALGIKRANCVALLAGLEARGLVRRPRVARDRRVFALSLTEAGVDLLTRLDAVLAEQDLRFCQRIGVENRQVLLDWLGRLA